MSRSLLSQLCKNFINSLKPRKFKDTLVGKDQHGTTYFEIVGDPNTGQRTSRWFEPKVKEDFQQELPAEWESWLRYRRKLPPEESEVLANAALALSQKQKAGDLDKKYKTGSGSLETPPQLHSFPTYEDYEVMPGIKSDEKK